MVAVTKSESWTYIELEADPSSELAANGTEILYCCNLALVLEGYELHTVAHLERICLHLIGLNVLSKRLSLFDSFLNSYIKYTTRTT